MKYKCINGWTKEKMLEVIKARKFDEVSYYQGCVYLQSNGNKCAVGLFIPENHVSVQGSDYVNVLLYHYPDLQSVMPLKTEALMEFQKSHDSEVGCGMRFKGNAKAAMLDWVERNVE